MQRIFTKTWLCADASDSLLQVQFRERILHLLHSKLSKFDQDRAHIMENFGCLGCPQLLSDLVVPVELQRES